jgi:Rrf2 family nitric oxide-sensitive transcriptional repressor
MAYNGSYLRLSQPRPDRRTMQLTRYTDYSLRVLMYLAVHPERLATITEISDAYDISRNHLVKVVHELGTLGFIKTQRGKQGGIRLARAPTEINIGEVVRRVEKNLDIVNCNDPACPILPACDLRDVLFEARDAFLRVLDSYTLDDLTAQQTKQLRTLLPLA